MLGGFDRWNAPRVDISFNFSCFIVHNCLCGKRCDPSRPSRGVFSSSAVQTPASLSGGIRSLCWSCFGASCCHLLDICSETTLECLLSRTIFQFYSELYFVFSISVYVDSNKRGQTSRPLPGSQVQANCNLKRTYVIVVTFWVVSSVCSTAYVKSYLFTIRYSQTGIVICLVTSIFSYTNIFINLRKHHIQVQDPVSQRGQPSHTQQLNMARYRKAVSSALWLQLVLVLCYLAHGVVTALSSNLGLTPSLALIRQFTMTLVYFNSSLNPILYCWKIREVRQAVKDVIKQFICSSTNENVIELN